MSVSPSSIHFVAQSCSTQSCSSLTLSVCLSLLYLSVCLLNAGSVLVSVFWRCLSQFCFHSICLAIYWRRSSGQCLSVRLSYLCSSVSLSVCYSWRCCSSLCYSVCLSICASGVHLSLSLCGSCCELIDIESPPSPPSMQPLPSCRTGSQQAAKANTLPSPPQVSLGLRPFSSPSLLFIIQVFHLV